MSIDKANNRLMEEDKRFTPEKVQAYCISVALISGIFSIIIDWLGVLSLAAFVFASLQYGTCLERNFIDGWKREEERDVFFDDIYLHL